MFSMLLIDGNMLAHRCYHGMPDLSASDGTPTGMEYGFLRLLENLERRFEGARLVICWDAPNAKSKRQRIADYYKAQRKSSADRSRLYGRLSLLKEQVLRYQWARCESDGLEADDLLYTLAADRRVEPGTQVLIYTNDKDLLQCVSGESIVVLRSHEHRTWIWDEAKVWEEYSVRPHQLPLLRSVLGDRSDNLPGCGAFGREKTAEYVRAAYRLFGNTERLFDLDEVTDAFFHVVDKDVNRYTDKAWGKWAGFYEGGFLDSNFKLSRLESQGRVEIQPPIEDTADARVEALRRWEIRSLRMCKDLMAADFEDEEF